MTVRSYRSGKPTARLEAIQLRPLFLLLNIIFMSDFDDIGDELLELAGDGDKKRKKKSSHKSSKRRKGEYVRLICSVPNIYQLPAP